MTEKTHYLSTEAEWQAKRQDYIERELKALAEEDMTDHPFQQFFNSGDINQFIDDCTKDGTNPMRAWGYLFACDPFRDCDLLKNNIKILWDWVLEDEHNRLSKGPLIKGQDQKTSNFLRKINTLGSVNSKVLDPDCAAELFLWVYGEKFDPKRKFPIAFGEEEWSPVLNSEPEEQFADLISLYSYYMFDTHNDIIYRQCIKLTDYFFSLIPYLTESKIFDTVLHKELGRRYVLRQKRIREFFANLAGYNVIEEIDELPHNDVKLEETIKVRLSDTEMPKTYYKMSTFIKKHKGESLNISEDI